MNMMRWKSSLSSLVCCVLIAATALLLTGCDSTQTTTGATPSVTPEATVSPQVSPEIQNQELGQGQTTFTFTVVDEQGQEETYQIHTDQTTVGDALVELGLIDGEESEYGLYVKTVNGITVDYNTDGRYWAFYVDGAYAQTGVDSTQVTEGATYTFKVE